MWTPGTLPNIRRGPNASSHPYPFQIAIRAQTFIAGATFYYAVASAGLGEYFSAGPSSYECIKNLFLQRGLSPVAWETNWKSFESYVNTFPDPILQNALILATTHWDAYVSRLANFIAFARHSGSVGGQAFALMVMGFAAAEVAVGLAIVVALYRRKATVQVDDINLLKG